MNVPEPVRRALATLVNPGVTAQAFPLITTDERGMPHVCLLSVIELRVRHAEILAALAGRRTRTNLLRSGRALPLAHPEPSPGGVLARTGL
jgi:hypothetical protein